MHWTGTVLRDGRGTAVGVVSHGRGHHRAGVVWAERRQLSAAVEQSFAAILITAPDGTIAYVNPAYERLSGYSKAEMVGENPRAVNSGDAVSRVLSRRCGRPSSRAKPGTAS